MREVISIAKALADEHRTRALMFLRHGELCVCQIVEMLGLAPSTISKHMAILRDARLVESRKEGRWIYYRLADGAASPCVLDAIQWVQRHLEEDAQIRQDLTRLHAVWRMTREELCLCYGAGNKGPAMSKARAFDPSLTPSTDDPRPGYHASQVGIPRRSSEESPR